MAQLTIWNLIPFPPPRPAPGNWWSHIPVNKYLMVWRRAALGGLTSDYSRRVGQGFESIESTSSQIRICRIQNYRILPTPTLGSFMVQKMAITSPSPNFLRLKTDKASGPDGIPPRFLKEIADELAPALCCLFHLILKSCTYPSWKHAVVQPVPKKGDCSNLSLVKLIFKQFFLSSRSSRFMSVKGNDHSLWKSKLNFLISWQEISY